MLKECHRRTVVLQGRLAAREWRLKAARERSLGLHIVSIEQLAARLAGGFLKPLDDENLRAAIQAALPETRLGELDGIKDLPGMIDAAADTLRKSWRAGMDLQARAGQHSRLQSMAALEAAVLARLPTAMKRPAELAAAAMQRLDHVPALFGPIDLVGLADVPPCWHALLKSIAKQTPTRWLGGPRAVPSWLEGSAFAIEQSAPQHPTIQVVSASTGYHEAIEAMRWARSLLASGRAQPSEIAIAAVAPAEYDDHFLALRADANLDLHFVHGVKVTASRDGQAAAALADILARGLSQTRMRRLAALHTGAKGAFEALPAGWTRILPADAPLTSVRAWDRLLDRISADAWPDGVDHSVTLRDLVALLNKGVQAASEVGEAVLSGRALAIWRKALLAGPAASIEVTLENLKQDDGLEACVSVAWMPASELAAAPRRFVRLLGLNSSRWPRGLSDDRLLSDHIVPAHELDPFPVAVADRHSFRTILATTAGEVVLSRSRRDGEGRIMGRSALLQGLPAETYLRRNAVPEHAFSETDRLLARPVEFQASEQAMAASRCWHNWHVPELTPHDGVIRADHPVMQAIFKRAQSASSLKQLLRNPLGFVWQYGMRWQTPESGNEPLTLEAVHLGNLVHLTLDSALRALEAQGGMATAGREQIVAAVRDAASSAAALWEAEQAVPPQVIWHRNLDDVREWSVRALMWSDNVLPGARAYGEVPFGGATPKSAAPSPWDTAALVEIPGTGIRISGYIDRLDISPDGRQAVVRDYKTGRPLEPKVRLDGGKELQRCLYAFAVKALLGDNVETTASLLYPREFIELPLEDADAALAEISAHLSTARASLLAGSAVIGTDTGGPYDKFAFALPANAAATYCKRKLAAATERLGDAVLVWEAK